MPFNKLSFKLDQEVCVGRMSSSILSKVEYMYFTLTNMQRVKGSLWRLKLHSDTVCKTMLWDENNDIMYNEEWDTNAEYFVSSPSTWYVLCM